MVKEKVIIFGAGSKAELFIYRNEASIEIMFFLDNNPGDGRFKNKDVKKPDSVDVDILKSYKIIVCSRAYWSISVQLTEMGLQEFVDFLPQQLYQKKMMFLIGNCHLEIIADMLQENTYFNQQFGIYTTALADSLGGDDPIEMQLDRWNNMIAYADVILHQDIREENPYGYYFSSNYIHKMCRADCLDITMINIYGLGKIYYPWAVEYNPNNPRNKGWAFGCFPTADTILDKLIREGKNVGQIMEIVNDENLYSTEELENNVRTLFDKYKKREENCDIKIVEYIEKNYKDTLLFWDEKHPVNDVLYEKTKQILLLMGISHIEKYSQDNCRTSKGYQLPIYPAIMKKLKLKFPISLEQIRTKKECNLSDRDMNLEEYIRQYIFWCGDSIVKNRE